MKMAYLRRERERSQSIRLEWKKRFSGESQYQIGEFRFKTMENGGECTGLRVKNTGIFHAVVSSFISADHKRLLLKV